MKEIRRNSRKNAQNTQNGKSIVLLSLYFLRLLRLFADNPSEEIRHENIAARNHKMHKMEKAPSSPAFNFSRLLRLFAANTWVLLFFVVSAFI